MGSCVSWVIRGKHATECFKDKGVQKQPTVFETLFCSCSVWVIAKQVSIVLQNDCCSLFVKVEKSEQQALEYFQNQFFEAYGGAWTTKVDWFFHSVKHF
ncbi:hypothetical protein HPB48_025594 [Haemaphysalis longicornis]|uniref:Uncharacterized protein n=1 Tax=Haemaphysalis longicornis TaxID=44386 RepID=A0A9J6HA72_HAELO|nr:hypothetical protein HPB48_025594 [Haemaphysalis longicornis]